MKTRNESLPALDWPATYARLAQLRQELEAGGDLPRDQVTRILTDRASALARPLEDAPPPTEALELLVFSLAGERYGIDTAHALEVVLLRELTPVPCTPPFVLGVVNHRGRILPVVDIRRLLELPAQGVTPPSWVVAVEAGGMTFGIFTDAVAGIVRVGVHEVAPPRLTFTGDRQAFIRGVTGEMVAVLNLEALARDPRAVVNEEVG